jgi:hypothetical protein
MLHLAQVQNKENGGGVELRLLARQHSENSWAVINPENVPYTNGNSLHEDALVLVDLSDKREVLSIQNAKDWVLDLVQQYLTIGVSPNFLKEEAERAEQWRQKLTLDSQDLTRRHLEMEARREQIQTLEDDLKRQMEEKQKPKTDDESDSTNNSDSGKQKPKTDDKSDSTDNSDSDS